MEEGLKWIEELKKTIQQFAISNNELYKKCSDDIFKIEQRLLKLDMEKNSTSKLSEIFEEIAKLAMEINDFLYHGQVDTSPITLLNNEETSGQDEIKKYRINLFIDILKNLRGISKIDIPKLERVRNEWLQEKKNNKIVYSPIEIDIVEREFAQTVLEYQIKYLEEYRTLNTELLEFCNSDKLEKKLRERLLGIIQSKEKNTPKRLDFEWLYTYSNSIEELFQAISGVEIKRINDNKETKPISDGKIANSEHNNVPTGRNFKRGKVVVTLQFIDRFGKERNVEKEIRVKKSGKFSIPSRIKNQIISISIEGEINLIPEGTFDGCGNLKEVDMSNSTVKEIGEDAFRMCGNLSKLELPECLKKIGNNAFEYTGVRVLDLPKNVRIIGDSAFSCCGSLEEVHMLDSAVVTIGDFAFWCCKKLKKLDLPESLKNISNSAFAYTAIPELKMPKNVEIIGNSAFSCCRSLERVDMSDLAVVTIGNSAFECCENLNKLELPEYLARIEYDAFKDTGIIELKLPKNVTYIGSHAFSDCKNLKKLELPENLERIGEYAFENCEKLEQLELPENLEKIEDGAFEGTGIIKLNLPENVTSIGAYAFGECKGLLEVDMSKVDRETKIGKGAFSGCKKLVKLYLPQDFGRIETGMSETTGITTVPATTIIIRGTLETEENASIATERLVTEAIQGLGSLATLADIGKAKNQCTIHRDQHNIGD